VNLGDIYFGLIAWFVLPFVVSLLGLDDDRDPVDDILSGRLWRRLTSWTRILPPIAVAIVIVYWLRRASGPSHNSVQEMLSSVIFGVLFLILAVAVVPVLRPLYRAKGRLVSNAIVTFASAVGFVVPFAAERAAAAKLRDDRHAALRALDASSEAVRRKWTLDLRLAEAHGGEGVEPPMVDVLDDGDVVTIINFAGRSICVNLARVNQSAMRCQLRARKQDSRCVPISASGSEKFALPSADSTGPCASGPLEFQVGDTAHPEVGWWSDSAITEFDRKSDELRRRSNPATGRISGSMLVQFTTEQILADVTRLTRLAAETGRARRWREEQNSWAWRKQERRAASGIQQ
jgi:hypothetical protein